MKKRRIKWIRVLTFAVMIALTLGTFTTISALNDLSRMLKPSDLFTTVSGFTLQSNQDVPDYMRYGAVSKNGSVYKIDENSSDDFLADWETNGVKVTTTVTNKKLYFANVLDINSLTADEEMIVFSPVLGNQGNSEITDMEIILEDVEDPNCYMSIRLIENQWWAQGTAIRVSANGISPVAYRWGDYGELSTYGSEACYISFKGYTQDPGFSETTPVEEFRHRAFKFHYDPVNKTLYSTVQGDKKVPILKLDDPHAVGYGNEWKGFTSGRVKLSIAVRSMKSTSASFMVFNVFGQELNGAEVVDNVAPVLQFEKAAKETPVAEVGKAYPLYKCQSEDAVYGALNCNVTVKDQDGNAVEVENGCFTPARAGIYEVVYSSVDGQNNQASKTFHITAQNGIQTISIDLDQDESSFLIGDEIKLPIATLSGGAGCLSYNVEVKRVGGEAVSVKNGAFVPILPGEYHVTYTATDYVGNQKKQTLSYQVGERVKPMVVPVQQIIRLYDGISVVVPMPKAYDYTSITGAKLNAICTLTAQNADGSYSEVISGGVFKPTKARFGDSVTFRYVVECNGGVGQKEEFGYTVPLLDLPEKVEGYFDFDDAIFETQYNKGEDAGYLSFITKAGVSGNQSIRFVNPLGSEGFELAFSIPASATNFSSFTIKLRDSVDATIGFDLEIRPMTSGYDKNDKLFVRSGGVDYAMSGTFNKIVDGVEVASGIPLTIKYTNGKLIDYSKKTICTPTVNFDGKEFSGFPSKKVMLEIEFNGVVGKAGITLTKISNQTLGQLYRLVDNGDEVYYEPTKFVDSVRPQIYLDEDVADEYKIGQRVAIPYARAYDVLSPHVDVLVTLCDSDGNYLINNEVVKENMSFILTSYGAYTLTYSAKDAAGRPQTAVYTISAKDSLAPTLSLKSEANMSKKVGDRVTFEELYANAIVQDENDTNPQLYVMIIAPNYSMTVLSSKNSSFLFDKAGTYYIRWYAIDYSYNAVWKDVTVKVA